MFALPRFKATLILGLVAGAFAVAPRPHRRQASPTGPTPTGTIKDCTYWDTAVDSTYTCAYFEDYWGLTAAQFLAYNPSVESDCSGIVVGDSYCVEENYGHGPPPTSTSTSSVTSTASPAPSPTQSGLISTCNNFYFVPSGATCQGIVNLYGTFTLATFYAWNPAVGTSCAGLEANVYVCVGVPGSNSATTTKITSITTGNGISTPTPYQTGMSTSCNKFHLVVDGDQCGTIASAAGISLANFYAWNPAVGSSCAYLGLGDYVCIDIIGVTPTTSHPVTTTTEAGNGITTPTPYQTGMATNCNKFHLVVSGDQCGAISSAAGVSLANFYAWNPAVGSSCQYLGLGDYVCIDVIGVTPTTSTSATKTAGNGVTTPTPYQAGMATNCNKFHLVASGDQCGTVASNAGITLANFYKWNPAVGSSCMYLDLGDYVCIGTLSGS